MADVITNMRIALAETGAEVLVDTLPMVLVDEQQISQVFQNILSNAIKYHGPGPPRIEVHAHRSNGDHAFAIKENGIGIDAAHHERIFQMFQRLHNRDL